MRTTPRGQTGARFQRTSARLPQQQRKKSAASSAGRGKPPEQHLALSNGSVVPGVGFVPDLQRREMSSNKFGSEEKSTPSVNSGNLRFINWFCGGRISFLFFLIENFVFFFLWNKLN